MVSADQTEFIKFTYNNSNTIPDTLAFTWILNLHSSQRVCVWLLNITKTLLDDVSIVPLLGPQVQTVPSTLSISWKRPYVVIFEHFKLVYWLLFFYFRMQCPCIWKLPLELWASAVITHAEVESSHSHSPLHQYRPCPSGQCEQLSAWWPPQFTGSEVTSVE